jgi:hypothetical protein
MEMVSKTTEASPKGEVNIVCRVMKARREEKIPYSF